MATHPKNPAFIDVGANYGTPEGYTVRYKGLCGQQCADLVNHADVLGITLWIDTVETPHVVPGFYESLGYVVHTEYGDHQVLRRDPRKRQQFAPAVVASLHLDGTESGPIKTIDIKSSSDTKWLVNHIVWCICNNVTVAITPII